jgi:DNA-binding MarR family transcriptional regulator
MDRFGPTFRGVTPEAAAARVAELFPALYLRFHRRDEPRSELGAAARATLLHLANTGPLTVGELARHLKRAQSVVSEIVEHLEAKGLLERVKDTKDRRRSLIWLSDAGLEGLERDRDVLSRDLLLRATRSMTETERSSLVAAMLSLLEADDSSRETPTLPTHGTRRKHR